MGLNDHIKGYPSVALGAFEVTPLELAGRELSAEGNGGGVSLAPPGGKITVNAHIVGNEAQVSVSDTGPGISDEATKRIFEPYWQVQETRTGMGLGLFIAKTIVESQTGRLTGRDGTSIPFVEVLL